MAADRWRQPARAELSVTEVLTKSGYSGMARTDTNRTLPSACPITRKLWPPFDKVLSQVASAESFLPAKSPPSGWRNRIVPSCLTRVKMRLFTDWVEL